MDNHGPSNIKENEIVRRYDREGRKMAFVGS
jgi:hypothetical protein